MKKFIPLFFILLLLLSCSRSDSFSDSFDYRTVTVIIPEHPWEMENTARVWYSLVIKHGDTLLKRYISPALREYTFKIPGNQTVFVCAYPLDSLRPFGCAFTPLSGSVITMDQNMGYLADIIINGAGDVAGDINFDLLVNQAYKVCKDFRYIEEATLLADILNGQLGKNSVNVIPGVEIKDLEVYSGTWIGESVFDLYLNPEELVLPVGVHRFYSPSRDLEMRIVVNNDGTYSKYEDRALVPLAQN